MLAMFLKMAATFLPKYLRDNTDEVCEKIRSGGVVLLTEKWEEETQPLLHDFIKKLADVLPEILKAKSEVISYTLADLDQPEVDPDTGEPMAGFISIPIIATVVVASVLSEAARRAIFDQRDCK